MSARLWQIAVVNPATREFGELPPSTEVDFMPLEACWPDGRADYSRVKPAGEGAGYTPFRRGDVLVPKITPTFEAGRSFAAQTRTAVGLGTTELHVLRPRPGADERFISYVVRSLPFLTEGGMSLLGVGNLRRVTHMFVKNFPLHVTGTEEQRQIADLLDRETAKIDALVTKQEQLIATLRERRTAQILEAVTAAHSVRTRRASHSTWVKTVPEHWREAPLKFAFASIVTGSWGSDPGTHEVDVRCARVADFDRARLLVTDTPTVRSVDKVEFERKQVLRDDLLLEKSGGTGLHPVGFTCLYDADGDAICSNFLIRLRVAGEHDPRYWLYSMTAAYASGHTQRFIRQTTGIQNLEVGAFLSSIFLVPPRAEQEDISDRLDASLAKIDALIAKAERFIELSKERRAALITAAVTGQLEIPDAPDPETETDTN